MFRKTILSLFFLFLLSLGTTLAVWPVNVISICTDGGEAVFSAPVPEGWAFTSRMIHSLEKTPVEDEYRVVSGRIWQWEERFQSNNAGLPTEVPVNGRFLSAPGWFILRGGRNRWDDLHYRVGNESIGRNVLALEGFGPLPVFETFPGQRLSIKNFVVPLGRTAWVLCGSDLR